MTTNSRTWFYNEPEHRPYYIEERVNQTLWASRFGSIYLDCTHAESPFKMEGKWNGVSVTIEWVPNKWFTLRTDKEDSTLIRGFRQVLDFLPTLTYTEEDGTVVTEWHRGEEAARRLQDVGGRPNYFNVKTYKR
jgi:hypothetical protein